MIIRHYRAEISDGSGLIKGDNCFDVRDLTVIGENSINLVVDDVSFTTIRKERCEYFTCLNKPSICIHMNDSVWGNQVTYSLYTDGTKSANKIRKEIQEAIDKKIGFFYRGMDLSIIK